MPPQRGCQINLQTVSSLSTTSLLLGEIADLHLTAAKLVNILFASSNGSYLARPYLPILYTHVLPGIPFPIEILRFRVHYQRCETLSGFFLVHDTPRQNHLAIQRFKALGEERGRREYRTIRFDIFDQIRFYRRLKIVGFILSSKTNRCKYGEKFFPPKFFVGFHLLLFPICTIKCKL